MKHLRYLPIILIILFGVYWGARTDRGSAPDVPAPPEQELVSPAPEPAEAKVDRQPPVTVTVLPLEFGRDAPRWSFSVVLDTHEGSLDDDVAAVSVLLGGSEAEYRPTAWNGDGPGGHHRAGTLTFDAITPPPPTVTLVIRGIGGISERLFRWDVR